MPESELANQRARAYANRSPAEPGDVLGQLREICQPRSSSGAKVSR